MKEPKPRKSCAWKECRKPRSVKGLKPVYLSAALMDPFCSRKCCEAWYAEQEVRA